MTKRDAEFHELLVDLVRHYAELDRGRDAASHSSGEPITVVSNVACGDRIEVFRTSDHLRIRARGCAICRASTAIAAEAIRERNKEEIETIVREVNGAIRDGRFENVPLTEDQRDLYRAVFEYPARRGCATLPWEALQETVELSR